MIPADVEDQSKLEDSGGQHGLFVRGGLLRTNRETYRKMVRAEKRAIGKIKMRSQIPKSKKKGAKHGK
jgi:hypothetical protein